MRGISVLAAAAAALVCASAAGAARDEGRGVAVAAQGGSTDIVVLSSRPEHITGGDAVIRVDVPARVSLSDVNVFLNDTEVTSSFRQDGSAHALVGLVSGFVDGQNSLFAHAQGSQPGFAVRTRVRNSPSYGPIFSGPHQRPWICETVASGLGPAPASGPCVAPTRYDWFYRTTAGQFAP